MTPEQFEHWLTVGANWSAKYRKEIEKYPVRSSAAPGDTLAALPDMPPLEGEDFAKIFADFERIVPPGLTHWQHPRFFAYFPGNSSMPSVLAEQLTAAIGGVCMLWQTSPVATEMEIRVLDWLKQMCGLPRSWQAVIQDSASSATLAAVITMRERALEWQGMKHGLAGQPALRIYCTRYNHSSVDKAVRLAGIGNANQVTVSTDDNGAMSADALRNSIVKDRAKGFLPAGVIAVIGGTTTGYSDKLRPIGKVAEQENLYLHVDAAWAGTAMVCPEHRELIDGLELADSYVFNPHKWMGVNFDCSAHFLKDASSLVRTMSATPDYLSTTHASDVTDFCNWSIPLGRRFRALKLWFVIRSYGITGLQRIIRNHIDWAQQAAKLLAGFPEFELLIEPQLSLFVFRHRPPNLTSANQLNKHNNRLLEAINLDGYMYLTPTVIDDTYALRMQVGHVDCERKHVLDSIERIKQIADKLVDT